KPRRYAYYRCVGSDAHRFEGGRVCHNPQVRVDQLDGYVWDSVRRTLEDPREVIEEWSRRGAEDGTIGEMRTQHDEAKRMVATQEQVLRRLRDAYEAGALGNSMISLRAANAFAHVSTGPARSSRKQRSSSNKPYSSPPSSVA